ncbi:MAG: diacylglycerol kinase [Pseudomonadota bacterium]|nr:diacylglycerol kinase [Pseudomonadota bacterium]
MKATDTGIKRILKAFIYSRDGFTASFKSEAALRQDLAVFIVFSLVALCLDLVLWQKMILISSLLFIVIMELVNTAVETVIDRISPDYHELSKKAKDIGSLLVLLSFVNAFLLWGAFLYPLFF